jgi:carbamoyl-phosphate synthase large subunit
MIAGIGGASLGTEIQKALALAGGYEVYGCDVSPTAYGVHDPAFAKTYRVTRDDYVGSVLAACRDADVHFLIAGGEQPTTLLGAAAREVASAGLTLLGNDPNVIAICSDKRETFRHLDACGIRIPRTAVLTAEDDAVRIGLPCIVKPATGSGGSSAVFFSATSAEAMLYAASIRQTSSTPIVQEYVDVAEGEFTISVLSLTDGRIAGSMALRRALDAKLSVAYRGRGGVISSGYSQGYIDTFPDLCRQAEAIAVALGSRGPLNVQGRVRNGVLLPFEVNPRFSASTYLRALAGFNEVDVLLRYASGQIEIERPVVRPGWYLRTLAERYVAPEAVP